MPQCRSVQHQHLPLCRVDGPAVNQIVSPQRADHLAAIPQGCNQVHTAAHKPGVVVRQASILLHRQAGLIGQETSDIRRRRDADPEPALIANTASFISAEGSLYLPGRQGEPQPQPVEAKPLTSYSPAKAYCAHGTYDQEQENNCVKA